MIYLIINNSVVDNIHIFFELPQIKKYICIITLHKIFNKLGFKITIDAGLIQTDFLESRYKVKLNK